MPETPASTHDWDLHLVLDGYKLREERLEVHAVLQGLRSGALDDRTVGQGVAEGDAHLDHRNASTLHGEDDVGRTLERRTACTEIEAQQFAVASVGKKGIDFIDHIIYHLTIDYSFTIQFFQELP